MTRSIRRRGTSLIDLLISMGIIAVLFGGIYLVYFSLITSISNIGVRTAATSAINAEIEMIRNLPYASVGTVGGIPSGVIPQSQIVTSGNFTFTMQTTVRNIDDPFDGTATGNPPPVDTAPDDYKLVEIDASCPLCENAVNVAITTTVAPKNLESATDDGSLFIYALDANGDPVSGADITVVNASVTPSIDLTDTTNASGVLELVGTPTSTQGYQVSATKAGYSTDQTYPPGGGGNPNPVLPNATVVPQTVTAVTLSIDRTSVINFSTANDLCEPIPNVAFGMQGTKIIGTDPDVLKFSTTTTTNASGTLTMSNVEWDTYNITLNDSAEDIAGTVPFDPITVNPSSTVNFQFVLQPAEDPSLLVSAIDSATGVGVPNAVMTISKGGTPESLAAGREFVTQNSWSGGAYASQSGGIDTTSKANAITLLLNASGTYNTGTNDWLISNTFDLGSSSSTLYVLSWDPGSEPANTSAEFQVAANNDDATWNFVGPDGTGSTFFTASSSLPASLSGNRYVRYEVYLNTTDPNATPEIDDVTLEFSTPCVPPYQALFTSLAQGSYSVDVTAPNYTETTSTASVGSGESFTTVSMPSSQ